MHMFSAFPDSRMLQQKKNLINVVKKCFSWYNMSLRTVKQELVACLSQINVTDLQKLMSMLLQTVLYSFIFCVQLLLY